MKLGLYQNSSPCADMSETTHEHLPRVVCQISETIRRGTLMLLNALSISTYLSGLTVGFTQEIQPTLSAAIIKIMNHCKYPYSGHLLHSTTDQWKAVLKLYQVQRSSAKRYRAQHFLTPVTFVCFCQTWFLKHWKQSQYLTTVDIKVLEFMHFILSFKQIFPCYKIHGKEPTVLITKQTNKQTPHFCCSPYALCYSPQP